MPNFLQRSIIVPGLLLAVLLAGCSTRPAGPDVVQPGGYRFELYTRALPEEDPQLAVTGVFFFADEPFADSAALLRQREALADIAPLGRLERHMLAAGKSDFCFAALPAATAPAPAVLPPRLAFSMTRGNPRMVEVLMHHDAGWAYAWVLTPDGRGGVRGEGRGAGRLWELYEDRIRVIPDSAVSVESCIDFAHRGATGGE